jgi:hypothetical protein
VRCLNETDVQSKSDILFNESFLATLKSLIELHHLSEDSAAGNIFRVIGRAGLQKVRLART